MKKFDNVQDQITYLENHIIYLMEYRYTAEEITAWLNAYHDQKREIPMTRWIQAYREKKQES